MCNLWGKLTQSISNPGDRKMIPLYISVALILLFILYEQTKSNTDHIADKILLLLKEDFAHGKFRNGIRVDDIYLCYGVVVGDSRHFFYSKILPKMEEKITSSSSSIEKTLNRAGILVWKLKE